MKKVIMLMEVEDETDEVEFAKAIETFYSDIKHIDVRKTNADAMMSDIINKNEYFAVKTWSKGDIRDKAEEDGVVLTEEQVNEIACEVKEQLKDCSDDYITIGAAISQVAKKEGSHNGK